MAATSLPFHSVELLRRLLAYFAHPGAPRVVIGLAMLLASPVLFSSLYADDWIQVIRMHPDRTMAGLDKPDDGLFVFASDDPTEHAGLMEEGILSWWAADDFRLAFFRPVAAATHHLDFHLWGANSVGIHAHSLLWLLLLLVALHRLYARFHAPKIAVLALALYAFDDARGHALGWACNRNALIAGLFGVGVLIAHDRWRRDGWSPGALLGPILLGIGLAAAELALSTTAFLFAYALCIDRGPIWTRLGRLVPYAAVVVVWQILHSHMGYGAVSSGIYVHPLVEPLRFLAKLVERMPILALGQLGFPPSDPWFVYPRAVAVCVYLLALLTLGGFSALIWPLLRRDPTVQFWILGATLALIPISATFPMDRLLVFVGIGASGALACLFAAALDSLPSRGHRRAIIALAMIHLVMAPLLLPLRSLTTRGIDVVTTRLFENLPRDSSVEEGSLVVIQAMADGAILYPTIEREARDIPRPRNVRILATGLLETRITRLDAQTLRLRPADGFYAGEAEQMVRSPTLPFVVGQTVALSNLTVTVTEVNATGRAMEAEFRFDRPLEAPDWIWMFWDEGRLVSWIPPGVGEAITLTPRP